MKRFKTTPIKPLQKPPGKNEPLFKTKTQASNFFDVFVRRKGKFSKVTKKPLTERSALGLGGKITGETPAATFKIERSTKQGDESKAYGFKEQNFYKRKDAYIEKNKFRINTAGEISGISKRGQAKRRLKKWAH